MGEGCSVGEGTRWFVSVMESNVRGREGGRGLLERRAGSIADRRLSVQGT